MKRSRFTEEQIAMALLQAEAGTPVVEICRSLQITEQTFYRWKKKYGSLRTPEIRELRQLREEKKKLKQLVADLTLDKHILQESLKTSSKAQTSVPVGRLGHKLIPGIRSPGMPDKRFLQVVDSVQVQATGSGAFKETDQGTCVKQGQLRISPSSCFAEARGLADQPQACVQVVP